MGILNRDSHGASLEPLIIRAGDAAPHEQLRVCASREVSADADTSLLVASSKSPRVIKRALRIVPKRTVGSC